MELIEALKKIYADSDKLVLIADKNMEALWENSEKLAGFSPEKLRLSGGPALELPVKQTLIAEYQGLFGGSCAVEIQPVEDTEQIYLLRFGQIGASEVQDQFPRKYP